MDKHNAESEIKANKIFNFEFACISKKGMIYCVCKFNSRVRLTRYW